MTPEEQNVAIAEWCGWWWGRWQTESKRVFCPPDQKPGAQYGNVLEVCEDLTLPIRFSVYTSPIVPDFCNDLNAMHEAEEKLMTGNGWKERLAKYSSKLMSVMHETDFGRIDVAFHNDMVHLRYFTLHATAAQRAESLLKTIGKWREHQIKLEKPQ